MNKNKILQQFSLFKLCFLATMIAILGGTAAFASSLYVDTLGLDVANNCLIQATPCQTINYAVSQATAGDTIEVGAGIYPEMVTINKSLSFLGANSGISAGTTPGVRGPESIVKGFRSSGNPGAIQYNFSLDGFTIVPQGDTTLISASAQPLVWMFGGSPVQIVNNIFNGAASYTPDCSFTCTTMTDYALEVRSGTILIENNSFTNFRRPVNILMTAGLTPIISTTINQNVITNVTSRAFQFEQSVGLHSMPGVTATNNMIDASGFTSPSSPGGMIINQDSNTITGNTFTGLASGVWISLCNKWSTEHQTITDNNFIANDGGIYIDDFPLTAYSGLTSQCYNLYPSFGGDINDTVINNNNFEGNTSAGVSGFTYINSSSPAAFTSTAGGVSFTSVTNASPIVITTSSGHGLTTGKSIVITGVGGNTAANGTWTVTKINGTQFSLDGSTGNGTYTSGGEFYPSPLPTLPATGTLDANCNWWDSVTGPGDAGIGSGQKIFPGVTFVSGVTFFPRPPEFTWLLAEAPGGACTGGTLAPTASFLATPTSGDAPLNVSVDATASTDTDGVIVSYAWDFGDGTNDTGVTASHTYTAAGTYILTLLVTDNAGQTATSTTTITVNAVVPPVVNSGATGGSAQFGRPACEGEACSSNQPVQIVNEVPPTENPTTSINSCGRDNLPLPFVDMENHWSRLWVEDLFRKCVLDGRTSDQFSPDENATRAEVVKIAARLFDLNEVEFTNLFLDVGRYDWFSSYVLSAADAKVVVGFKVNLNQLLFKPSQDITRAEALKILLLASGIKIENNLTGVKYVDVSKADWFYEIVTYATEHQVIEGYTAPETGFIHFGPNKPITRAEIAKIAELIANLAKQ